MANELPVTHAGIDYLDRTRALIDGTVRPAGVALRYVVLPPSDLFRRVAQFTEFDSAEMSISTYMHLIDSGDDRWIAIPVFPSRNFRHGCIFVSAKSAVREPKDLAGARVGAAEYQQTALVWQRAALLEDYGLRPEDVRWFEGGLRHPGYVERAAMEAPPGVSIERIPEDKSLEGMLAAGELDALLSPNTPPALVDGSGRVRRLFTNWVEVEQDYYRRTGFHPMMHLVVIRRDLYRDHRWLAASLLDAFVKTQRLGWRRLLETGSLAVALPWLRRDLEEVGELFGGRFWQHGFQENYAAMSALCDYHHGQGLSRRHFTPEELFAPETHQLPLNPVAALYEAV